MFLRFCTIVPAYNNPRTVGAVVKELIEKTDSPVIVVDDGSNESVQEILRTLFLEMPERLVLKIHEKNLGKGKALQTGFQEALLRGFTHALVFDADGQHLASEISKLIQEAKRHPSALVIGAREMAGENVPPASRFGRRFSNFWVDRETGTKISDSQSGMRVYPLFPIQMMRFFTSRYDFEIEILIRLMWKGIEIKEVPVAVSYEPVGRVSHFRKGVDNMRISILNTVLVFLSMLKLPRNPVQMGVAVGVGVFIGTTPLFGFHTPLAFLFAILLRLNFGFVWAGTQISIPPFAPFLAAASVEIDKVVFPNDTGNVLLEWLDGSLVLGAGLGLLIGSLTAFGAWFFKMRAARRIHWTGKMRGGKFGNGFLNFTIHHFGLRAGYFCLYFIVPYFYLFAIRSTRASCEYWKVVRPEAKFLKRQWLVLSHYHSFGKVLLDKRYQSLLSGKIFETHSNGAEYIERASREKKGLIMLSAHVGSWDIAAYHMQFKKLEKQFHTVEYGADVSVRDEKPGDFIQSIFHNQQSHAVLDIHGLLGSGKPIGVMGDRPTTRRFELVPFMGKLVAIDVTAFRMAVTLNVQLLFTFGFRRSDGTYDFFATPPQTYSFAPDESQDVQCFKWASEFASTLESFVKRYEMQWFNFYPFFSSLPASAGF